MAAKHTSASLKVHQEALFRCRRLGHYTMRRATRSRRRDREVQDQIDDDERWLFTYAKMYGSTRLAKVYLGELSREAEKERHLVAHRWLTRPRSVIRRNGTDLPQIRPDEDPVEDLRITINAAMESLLPTEQAVLLLMGCCGFSSTEVGARLGIPKSNVQRVFRKAKTKMLSLLQS